MLDTYGWSEPLQRLFHDHAARGLIPGRVTVQQRGHYGLVIATGEVAGELSGRFHFEAEAGGYPVAGDWVACTPPVEKGPVMIQALLPRATSFVRREPNGGRAQVVAANIDLALLVASLNADLNARRIERYLATAWESGAQPVVVLTKLDTCADPEPLIEEIRAVAYGVEVHAVSAVTGEGIAGLSALLAPGKTAVLLGSSGVGKSTLVNALAGQELMETQEIREDDARGRHTTTHRELVLLPSGGLMLDTPGMRELGLWNADAGLATAFGDLEGEVEALAAQCKFRDCKHVAEPGCAVRAALESGELDAERWEAYGKLQRELAHLDRKENPAAASQARKVWIQRQKDMRQRTKHRETDD
ncbi:ribosome small subunit-dependent GTPase A [Phenylobacterium sp.]|uniref:ribosome small subunit-dependent GTPase A n=1 Tax=Phenylobacterium sp. TaxID=1871053 RepID=UPI00286CDD33|nr:ribosome small subunit-dependent GTPase A [Phenylobacterium sp.]